MTPESLQPVAAAFGFLSARPSQDHASFNCPLGNLREVATALRDRFGFALLMDVTAVDWEEANPRFSVVYHFYSLELHEYLRLVVPCEDDANPSVPSLADLYPAADWHERETYDMFGIVFVGHPDLRRILMWEEYPYYPLRKEFPLAGIETEIPDREVADETGVRMDAAPMMGGPFVAKTGTNMSKAEPRAADQSWTEKRSKPGSED